jgi:hypothetical protein
MNPSNIKVMLFFLVILMGIADGRAENHELVKSHKLYHIRLYWVFLA